MKASFSNQFPIQPKRQHVGYVLVDLSAGKMSEIQRAGKDGYPLLRYVKNGRQDKKNLKIVKLY